MTRKAFDIPSLVTGAAVAVAIVSLVGFRAPTAQTKWEFKMTTKHSDKILEDLGDDGWDYAGYLGASKLGGGEAVGLWRKPQ